MTPRFDHRPPLFAFLFLVVLAIAVVGTNARAVDRRVVAAEPLAPRVRVSGTAVAATPASAGRVDPVVRARPTSRAEGRGPVPARHRDQSRAGLHRAVAPSHQRLLRLPELQLRQDANARGLLALGRHLGRHLGRRLGRRLGLPVVLH